jgi:hypothetical protein
MNGQAKLKALLDDKGFIYQPTDAIDTGLLKDLLRGATPSLSHADATFDATLTLIFDGDGVADTASKFKNAANIAATEVGVTAKFGREGQ